MRLSELESAVQDLSTHPSPEPRTLRIAMVGAGFVGSTTAFALMMSGMGAEIVVIDRASRRAEGQVNDLRDAEVFSQTTGIFVGDLSDCCSADVTFITAGVSQSGQKSRMEGLRDTGAIVHGLVNDICLQNPRGILLSVSNPVDVLTYAAWKWSGLPAGRVIGSGTSLDTSRFRRRFAEHYGIASANVHAYVIGEHGDDRIPVLFSARVAGFPLADFSKEPRLPYVESALTRIARETRTAGADIIEAKGATYYGIGAALVRVIRAILHHERAILTVSSRVPESMQLGDVALSLPSVDRHGIARVLPVALNRSERRALERLPKSSEGI
ncbi:MAG TPA: L-lactate dehydrogenase [Candidatus Polarisedimenticolia bacterium]|nr:L-lactate dehydrogenase [Candidatus Polarisedimenticolia bacterium]